MIGPRNVHPEELGDADGMELQDALRVGNRLSDAMDDLPVTPGEDFSDRVMSALADEPTPGTTGFLAPLRRRGFPAGLTESVRQALAAVGSGRPVLGRSAALAYVLAVAIAGISLTGAATLGAAGALGLLGSTATQSPQPTVAEPVPAPSPTSPPAIPPTPAPSPNASEPPDAPTPSPTESENEPEGSDDRGGNDGPGGGGDDSGSDDSGSGSDDSGSGSDDSGSGSDHSGSGSDDSRSSSDDSPSGSDD
jgi:hypothetical protein